MIYILCLVTSSREILQISSLKYSSHLLLPSTSHNTYLLSRQLLGFSSADAYANVVIKGCRCVEIDVWDSHEANGAPIVTHGLTFTESTPFQNVCGHRQCCHG
jgi:hypothetical protein